MSSRHLAQSSPKEQQEFDIVAESHDDNSQFLPMMPLAHTYIVKETSVNQF